MSRLHALSFLFWRFMTQKQLAISVEFQEYAEVQIKLRRDVDESMFESDNTLLFKPTQHIQRYNI